MPLFEHDCDECVFLGTYKDTDLYFCDPLRPTVLYRYGNDPSEYGSGLGFGIQFPNSRYGEALRRAVVKGLYPVGPIHTVKAIETRPFFTGLYCEADGSMCNEGKDCSSCPFSTL